MVTARTPAPMRVVVQADACWWWCQVCGFASRILPWRDALALAADEGRAHLRAVHAHVPDQREVEAFFADEACGCGEPLCDNEIRSNVARLCDNESGPGGAGNTTRSLTHSLDQTKEGLA